MTPLRAYFLRDLDPEWRLPPLEEGEPARDPFDAQFISSIRRTAGGFELRIETR